MNKQELIKNLLSFIKNKKLLDEFLSEMEDLDYDIEDLKEDIENYIE